MGTHCVPWKTLHVSVWVGWVCVSRESWWERLRLMLGRGLFGFVLISFPTGWKWAFLKAGASTDLTWLSHRGQQLAEQTVAVPGTELAHNNYFICLVPEKVYWAEAGQSLPAPTPYPWSFILFGSRLCVAQPHQGHSLACEGLPRCSSPAEAWRGR